MSMLATMQEAGQLPPNALLSFWEVIDRLDDDTDVTHVVFFDNPITGGWDESDTSPTQCCTREHLEWGSFRILGARIHGARSTGINNSIIVERVDEVTCVVCKEKILERLDESGVLEESYDPGY